MNTKVFHRVTAQRSARVGVSLLASWLLVAGMFVGNSAWADIGFSKSYGIDFTDTGVTSVSLLNTGGLLAIGGNPLQPAKTSDRIYKLYDAKGKKYGEGTLLMSVLDGVKDCVTTTATPPVTQCPYYSYLDPKNISTSLSTIAIITNKPALSTDTKSVTWSQSTQTILLDLLPKATGARAFAATAGSFPITQPLPANFSPPYLVIKGASVEVYQVNVK